MTAAQREFFEWPSREWKRHPSSQFRPRLVGRRYRPTDPGWRGYLRYERQRHQWNRRQWYQTQRERARQRSFRFMQEEARRRKPHPSPRTKPSTKTSKGRKVIRKARKAVKLVRVGRYLIPIGAAVGIYLRLKHERLKVQREWHQRKGLRRSQREIEELVRQTIENTHFEVRFSRRELERFKKEVRIDLADALAELGQSMAGAISKLHGRTRRSLPKNLSNRIGKDGHGLERAMVKEGKALKAQVGDASVIAKPFSQSGVRRDLKTGRLKGMRAVRGMRMSVSARYRTGPVAFQMEKQAVLESADLRQSVRRSIRRRNQIADRSKPIRRRLVRSGLVRS